MKKTFFVSGLFLMFLASQGSEAQESILPTIEKADTAGPMDVLLTEELIRSLRDPFQMPTLSQIVNSVPKSDLELFPVKDFRLNGVITGPNKTRAMVSAPNGKSYFLALGETIGTREGRVTVIQADSVKVVEYDRDENGKRIAEMTELRMDGEGATK